MQKADLAISIEAEEGRIDEYVTIIKELGSEAMIEALEANLAEEMACFGRGLPGGEIYEDDELTWFFTGQRSLNGVLHTRLATDEPAYVQRKITETQNHFRERGVGMGWSVGKTTFPANLDSYLEVQGFTYEGVETVGMAVDIAAVKAEPRWPEGLAIAEIQNQETLKLLRLLEMKGFGATVEAAQNYYDVYVAVGFGPGRVWRHYLGWLNGEAVSMASLLFHAGVAGIYGIATRPEARQKGVGTAMTLHAINEARAQGYCIAILTPTEMSEHIYREMGFREYTRIRHYQWMPG